MDAFSFSLICQCFTSFFMGLSLSLETRFLLREMSPGVKSI